MATIRKDPRNAKRWQVRYVGPDGKQHTKGGFKTAADAKAFKAQLEMDIYQQAWRDPRAGRMTVEKLAKEWLDNTGITKRATSRHRDRHIINHHVIPTIGDKQIAKVTREDMQKIINGLTTRGLKTSTIRGVAGQISALFNYAVKVGYLHENPCRGMIRPAAKPTQKRFLEESELVALAKAIHPHYYAFIWIGGVMGLRFSELAGLRVGSVNLAAKTITVDQGLTEVGGDVYVDDVKTPSSRRTLRMPKQLVDIVSDHLATRPPWPEARLFTGVKGGPLRYSNFHKYVWGPAVKAAGLNGLSPHGLRHTSVGFLIKVGAHPRIIQQRLGHSTIVTTFDVYGSVLPSADEDVTDSLGNLFDDKTGTKLVQDPPEDEGNAA